MFERWKHDPRGEKARARSKRARFHFRVALVINLISLPVFAFTVRDVKRGYDSTGWKQVSGEVTFANVHTSKCNLEAAHWIYGFLCSYSVEYNYVVAGQTHMGRRMAFPGVPPWSEVEPVFKAFADVPVYVDPDDPFVSVLLPGPEFRGGILARLVPESLLGIGGLIYLLFSAWTFWRPQHEDTGDQP